MSVIWNIEGFGYELRLAPMPDSVYRVVVEPRKVPLKPFHPLSPLDEIEITVRRLGGPSLCDAVAGSPVEIGPEIDKPCARKEYRRLHPDRRYAVAKRRLCKAELRRHGVHDHAPEDDPFVPSRKPDRAAFSRR